MSKILLCYFSATETTAAFANRLAKPIKADVYEIMPKDKYSEQDLNWKDKESRSSKEMSNPSARVEIIKVLENLDNYQKIILCFPIWWYTAPRIINSFLESYNFENKVIYVCPTSGSSGMGQITKQLQKTYPKYKFIEGKVLNHISDNEASQLIELILNI